MADHPDVLSMPGGAAINIFADFVSPHSYVTERALRAVAEYRPLTVRYRSLEMHPTPTALPDARDAAATLLDAARVAEAEGLTLVLPDFIPRTRKAHEAALFAAEHSVEGPFRDAVYRAYWEKGRDIARVDVLAAIGRTVGLDEDELKIALDIDRLADAVRHDTEIARRLNVRQVPTTYVGFGTGARILVGIQTRDGLDEAIHSS